MTTVTTTTQPPAAATAAQGYRVIGSRPVRHDGADKVTGRARYGADLSLPGMLHGKVLRSPHAHARIKAIDASRALAMPGVHAVATAADFPQPAGRVLDLGEGAMINPKFLSNNCLAAEKALYKGHAIAAVAADSPHEAELALALIEVEYEVLPPVTDVLEAMRADAPLLHERLANLNDPAVRPGGLLAEGDAGKPAMSPTVIPTKSATWTPASPPPMSSWRASSAPKPSTRATLNPTPPLPSGTPTAGTPTAPCTSGAAARDTSMSATRRPPSWASPSPASWSPSWKSAAASAAKPWSIWSPVAAVLSRKTGRPVKIQMSRAEVFEGTGPTSGGYLRVKMGATNDGAITAADVTLFYEAGAYPGLARQPRRPVRPVLLQHSQRAH